MRLSAARHPSRIACVLLAAGGSRRLGMPKQLVRYRGQSLLRSAVRAARTAIPHAPLIVVLGAHHLRLRGLLRSTEPHAIAVYNARWSDGLAGSLKAGLRAAPQGIQAVLVLLVDQPRVDAQALVRLLSAWRKRPGLAAAASYAGRLGVPAVLPRACWPALRALAGDRGARDVLRSAARTTAVPIPEASVDIDTPADLARVR